MSTTEGWIDVMNRGIDSVGIDMEPQVNHNLYWAFLFMFFIILGNFLILNLVVVLCRLSAFDTFDVSDTSSLVESPFEVLESKMNTWPSPPA